MKKLYSLFFVLLFVAIQSKGQGCTMTYSYDSTTTSYSFAINASYPNTFVVWDFGDSTSAVFGSSIVSHQYAVAGNYVVCATEYDSTGQIVLSYCCLSITAISAGGCSFNYMSNGGGTYSFMGNAPNAQYVYWTYGDGGTDSGINSTHTYTTTGNYTVCMTAYNSADTCNYCLNIFVNLGNPSCTISSITDSINPNTQYFFFNPAGPNNQIYWTFGDGDSAFATTTATHTYSTNGQFTACAWEFDSNGVMLCQACIGVQIGSVMCGFNVMPSSGPLNTFFFNGLYDSTLYTAVWNFGDGTIYGGGPNQTHTYLTPGTYVACMDVIDINQVIVCSYCQIVTATSGPTQCQANFTTVPFGLDAYFIDYSTADPSVTTYMWDFGDGSPINTQRFPMHTYTTPGTYTACLIIQNSGCSDSTCQTLVVDTAIINPVFCNAYFVFTQISPYQLAAVNLSSGTNLSFMWDFGDGNTSTAAYPIHNYASYGSYNICLTVADANGCTSTYCDTLSVDSLGNIVYRSSTVGFVLNVLSPTQLNTVSVNELKPSLISNIYPNPSKDRIFIVPSAQSGVVKYSILSLSSQKIKDGKMNSDKTEVDISELSPGIYFVELQSASGERQYARFVIE